MIYSSYLLLINVAYFPMQAQYKEPSFQLTADLYQTPTNYSFKPNPSSSMDPHAPKFSMGPRQSSKRNSHYPPMHHRQHSPISESFIYLFVCLFVCLFVSLFVCLSNYSLTLTLCIYSGEDDRLLP